MNRRIIALAVAAGLSNIPAFGAMSRLAVRATTSMEKFVGYGFGSRSRQINKSYSPTRSKYRKPHQGKQECARRIRQGLA